MGIERAIGRAIIERMAPTGMSANSIINLARDQGGSYRRTDMLEDIRVAGERFKNQYWVESLKSNEVVSAGLMVDKDLGIDRKYRVYGTYSYYDTETEDYYDETKSFYTNDLKNKGAWVDDYQESFEEGYAQVGEEYMGFSVTAVEHNTGWGY
ncbi:hypothetical protein ES707_06691 [subsurface metagenome]